MLVISRRPEERILLPTLGVEVQILRVQNHVVRVGIQAPPEVQILRAELADKYPVQEPAPPPQPGLTHTQRNRLNKATLSLHLLQRQLDADRVAAARLTVNQVIETLEALAEDTEK